MKSILRSFKPYKVNVLLLVLTTLSMAFSLRSFGQFTSGNLVVDEVGNGLSTDTLSASQVRLLQFTTAGVAQPPTDYFGSAGIPAKYPFNLVQSYFANDGFISLSGSKQFIVVPGYNDSTGAANISTSTTSSSSTIAGRTIGKALANGSLTTNGTYNALSGGSYSSLLNRGGNYWLGGSTGIAYSHGATTKGIKTATILSTNNVRVLNAFSTTLFASVDTGTGANQVSGIFQVGTLDSFPISGTPALVNIINTGEGSNPYAFAFNPYGTTCYIANGPSTANAGIQKWVYSGTFSSATGWTGGTWSLAYTLSTGNDAGAKGLTVDFTNITIPIIYATTGEKFNNRVVSIIDAGSSSAFTTLATAPAYYALKGIAFAPEQARIRLMALTPDSINTVYGTVSSNMVLEVGGINTNAGVTVTAPAGFELSLSATSGFGSSVVVGSAEDTIPYTPVYVRLKATDAVGTYTGDIVCTSQGAYTKNVLIGNSMVTPSSLTITADNETKCYGAVYTFTGNEFTTSGLVNSDAVSNVTLTSAGAAAAAGAGTYPIVASAATGTGLSNYTITYVNGTLTVELLAITLAQVNPDCNATLGSLAGTVTGGMAPYTYKLVSVQPFNVTTSSDSLFSSLSEGEYSYSAKDVYGCSVTAPGVGLKQLTQTSITITTPGNSTEVCYGRTATITTNVIGGDAPFNYSLNGATPVSSAERFFNVPAMAGTYTISVTDNENCTITTDPITITQPSAPITFSSQGSTLCSEISNSTITISASGGYGGFSYSDNGGSSYQSSPVFTGLSYGSYSVDVEDQKGCKAASPLTIEFTQLSSSAIMGNTQVCTGGSTTIYTVPSGGTPPYAYSLNGAPVVPSSERYFNVPAGTYTITVLDAGGCTYTTPSITVTATGCGGLVNIGRTPQASVNDKSNGVRGGLDINATAPAPQVVNDKIVAISGFEAHLSPNPAPSAFHLQMESSSKDDVELIVTNMMGVKVYAARGGIDGAYEFGTTFPRGMYILQIIQGKTVHTVKLIKGE